MPSLFRQVWTCCLRPRSPSPPVVDEHTHLIQPIHDDPPLPPNIATDHQKLRERLGMIVRAKEGKMINVGTPLPFNLHNRALHARFDPSGSTSSRSGHRSHSGSSGRRPAASAEAGIEHEGSTSRASSVQPPSSPSMTSLQQGYGSYLQHEEYEDDSRRRILNVRLASDSSGRTRKGRSRGRLGRFGEERGKEISHMNSIVSDTLQDEFAEGRSSPSVPSSPETLSKNDFPSTQEYSATEETFKIKDVGALTRSWRD